MNPELICTIFCYMKFQFGVLGAGWPDEFVEKSPKVQPNPFKNNFVVEKVVQSSPSSLKNNPKKTFSQSGHPG
jgi:hypothetical protein